MGSKPDIDVEYLVEKLNKIDLQRTLDKLPIPTEIRKIFQDVLGNKYTGEHAAETEELKEKLHKQKQSSKRGGVSMNRNIDSLEGKYEREIRFGKYNYMLNDVGKLFYSVTRNTVSGILNSYATKDREHNGSDFFIHNTRIESFGISELEILIFGLENNKDLRDMCIQYEVDDFKLDESGIDYLRSCINHLKDKSFLRYGTYSVRNSLMNLLFVISQCEIIDTLDSESVYGVVDYLLTGYEHVTDLGRFLHQIIRKYPPAKETSVTLLNKVTTDFIGDDRLEKVIEELCAQLKRFGFFFDSYPECLKSHGQSPIKMPLYDLLGDNDKQRFINEFLPKMKHFGYYMRFMYTQKLVPTPIDDFKDRLFGYSNNYELNISAVCRYLSEWRENEHYQDLWSLIDEYGKKSDCMAFFLTPLQFPSAENVKPEWIINLRERTKKELVKNQPYAHMMLDYITQRYMSPASRLSLLSMFEPDIKEIDE